MKVLMAMLFVLMLYGCSAAKKNAQTDHAIVKMDISGQNLTKWPDSVFHKPLLTHLFAGIKGWVATGPWGIMGECPHNHFWLLPDKLCVVRTLTVLDLAFNNIDTLPACFSNLDNLESLNLSFNAYLNIRQSIPVVARIKSLKELNLYYVPQAVKDSNWVREQFAGRNIKLTVTEQDMFRHYGRHEE